MFEKKIFRGKAIERLSSPEEFDVPLRIVNLKAWIFLVLLLLILSALFLWLSFSKVNQEISTRGIILKEDYLTRVLAFKDGFVDKVYCSSEDSIKKGEVLLNLISLEEERLLNETGNNTADVSYENLYNNIKDKSAVRSPVDGVVFEIIASEDSYVRTGDNLLTIQKSGGTEHDYGFQVLTLVPGRLINSIREGSAVLISPLNFDVKEYGYLNGEIRRIAQYPVSQERINILAKKNPVVFQDIQEKVFEVTVVPKISGNKLTWTSNKTPEIKFINGSACSLKIIINSKSIFSYIVP